MTVGRQDRRRDRFVRLGVAALLALSFPATGCDDEAPRVRLVVRAAAGQEGEVAARVGGLQVIFLARDGRGGSCRPCSHRFTLGAGGGVEVPLPVTVDFVQGSFPPYSQVWFVVRAYSRDGDLEPIQEWVRHAVVPGSGMETVTVEIAAWCVDSAAPIWCPASEECTPRGCLSPPGGSPPPLPVTLRGGCYDPGDAGGLEACARNAEDGAPCGVLAVCPAADADADAVDAEDAGDAFADGDD